MQLTGRTILITGGSSGIGRLLAIRLFERGNRVIITGRRQHLLDEITAAHPGMIGLRLDVAEPEAVAELAARVDANFAGLDMLVNNAGISRAEDLTDGADNLAVAEAIIHTNILGVLHVTAALMPLLLRQQGATILTVTSGLAFVPRANYPTYCASKAFLHSWLQSLRTQLYPHGVEVLELAPPYVQTELAGPTQAVDPAAMPLDEFVAETLALLDAGDLPAGEVLVDRVRPLREAERRGSYAEIYARLNPA
jgi:uncharacterized oxidoreductase